MCGKFAKNGISNINQTLFNLNKLLLSINWWNLIKCLLWNEESLFTKYKWDLFVQNSVTSATNALPTSWDHSVKLWRIIGCSHELGNEFLLEVSLFRTNKSHLYFVNNDSSFHSKHFTFDNNNFFKLNNACMVNIWYMCAVFRKFFTHPEICCRIWTLISRSIFYKYTTVIDQNPSYRFLYLIKFMWVG